MPYSFHVEPYCDNCPEFEVSVKRDDFYRDEFSLDILETGSSRIIGQSIGCKHARRCENMIKFLQKKLDKKEN